MKVWVKKADLYFEMPPFTAASIVPCNLMVKGLRFSVLLLVYSEINFLSSVFLAAIVSQANSTGLTQVVEQ